LQVRFTTNMLAAVHWYASTTLWTAVVDLVAAFSTIGASIVAYRVAMPRRSIVYGMLVSAPLLSAPSGVKPGLRLLHGDEELADPHLLEIELACRGRKDIPSSSFDQGTPFCIDVGIRIVALLQTTFVPAKAPVPKVAAVGSELRVGPSLIRKDQVVRFTVLADGPGARLTDQNPLIDVTVRQKAQEQARQSMLRRVITWAAMAFVVYYLATQPSGSAHFVHGVFNWLHHAGNSLATFVNSL
jgi:hypothetical protein